MYICVMVTGKSSSLGIPNFWENNNSSQIPEYLIGNQG